MDCSSRNKLNSEILELTDILIQMDLIVIYRTFDQNTKEYFYTLYLMELFPKLPEYSDTKQASTDRTKLK